jgi:hypothetical protein
MMGIALSYDRLALRALIRDTLIWGVDLGLFLRWLRRDCRRFHDLAQRIRKRVPPRSSVREQDTAQTQLAG